MDGCKSGGCFGGKRIAVAGRKLPWAAVLCLLFAGGCTTTAAKRAMNKPEHTDSFSGFSDRFANDSKRKARIPKAVPADWEAERAVEVLVRRLQSRERGFVVSAEDELNAWAQRPGVKKIIYRKVRLLLKNPRVEVRAPAVRLTLSCGGKESSGDLIELLGDEEYLIRRLAFQRLHERYGMDFGYRPAAGPVQRRRALEAWRRWWQAELRKKSRLPEPSPEVVPPTPAKRGRHSTAPAH